MSPLLLSVSLSLCLSGCGLRGGRGRPIKSFAQTQICLLRLAEIFSVACDGTVGVDRDDRSCIVMSEL